MNDSIKRISLDIHSTGSMETVNAKRGDTARKLIISLVDGGLPYIIGEDCSAKFYAKKPDRNVLYNYCTIKDNTIICDITGQTVAVEGRVNCEIRLIGADGKLITSPKFTINVLGTVYDDNAIESTDEFNALTSLIVDTQKAIKEAQKAIEDAEEAIKLAQEMEASLYITDASGSPVVINDASKHSLIGLKIFGKTTQDGTPTPDTPIDLVSVGDIGSVTVNVTGENQAQSMTIATPNGLPGIPVSSGGTYTDANGQQWICDEINLTSGVYLKRTHKCIFNGSANEDWRVSVAQVMEGNTRFDITTFDPLCGHQMCMCDTYNGTTFSNATPESCWCNDTSTTNSLQFRILTAQASSVNELRASLQSHPIEVIYVLATPIETPLSEEELAAYASLHTYRDNTTVTNDAGAYMELEYVMDAKKYIDSLVGSSMIHQATVG